MQVQHIRFFSIFFVILLGLLNPFLVLSASNNSVTNPRLANYFLKWDLSEGEARQLAKWHVVVLDMEIQHRRPDLLRQLRIWNPTIVLLAYITPQEVRQDALNSYSFMRRKLVAGVRDEWYLRSSLGKKLTWWPETFLLNVAAPTLVSGGQTWDDYLVKFVANDILGTGLWDGVFYDNSWDSVTHFAGSDIDMDGDNQIDRNPDAQWQQGMKYIYQQTRTLAPRAIIVGNGTTRMYVDDLNGKIMENFISGAWSPTMNTYHHDEVKSVTPTVNIINSNTANTGTQNYRDVRFGLGSAMLEDGYFSYDYGDKDHGQTWWYDEYNARLGRPISNAASRRNYGTYQPDLWRRDFDHGLVLVNSTPELTTVDLGGDYEKINGTQDRAINDGSIISEVEVAPNDGLILLKTASRLDDVVFANGSFARFYRPDGTRLRNGFFVFDEAYKGGAQVLYLDLDGNGKRDTLVASGNKITATRDDGQPFFKVYPYTASYAGNLRLAVGDLDNDGVNELYVAPDKGPYPVKILNLVGEEILPNWYPFGSKYQGGYFLAVAGSGYSGRLVVGAGNDHEPTVTLYDAGLKKTGEWSVFDKRSSRGVPVGAGDLNGDGTPEIIAGFGTGAKPQLKLYTLEGKEFAKPITFESQLFRSAQIQTADVDFDGKADIVLLTSGAL